jgi:hypothetical protein
MRSACIITGPIFTAASGTYPEGEEVKMSQTSKLVDPNVSFTVFLVVWKKTLSVAR